MNFFADMPPSVNGKSTAAGAHDNGQRADTKATGRSGAEEWQEPTPLEEHGPLPTFPTDQLTPTLREWALAVAEATQTPVDLAAALALATLSAAVQKKFEAVITPGWSEPLSTYWCAALDPGNRKSAVYSEATKPLSAWEAERAREMAPRIQEALVAHGIKSHAFEAAKKTAAKAGVGMLDSEQKAQQLGAELASLKVPVAPQITADDATPESLSVLLSEQGGRIAVMSPEGGIFDTIAGRYSNGVANIDLLLKGHPGDPLKVDRVRRASVWIQRPAVTLGLTVQPSVLEGLATKKEFRGRGLLARFFFVVPESRVGFRNTRPPPVPDTVRRRYAALCQSLLALPERRDPLTDEIAATEIRFSDAARECLLNFADELEPRLRPGADLEPIRDWAAKLIGGTARLAALLHLASGFEDSEDFVRDVVIERWVERARIIATYLLTHSLAAFRSMGADPDLSRAIKLLARLRKLGTLRITRRDLHQAVKSSFPKADELDKPLTLLEENGHVRVVTPSQKGPGRPSPIVLVNPRTLEDMTRQTPAEAAQ